MKVVLPQFDKGYQEKFTIYTDGSQTEVQNLTGYDVRMKVWSSGSPTVLFVDDLMTISHADKGECYWTVTEHATENIGRYKAEIQLEKTGIILSTIAFDLIIVESAV